MSQELFKQSSTYMSPCWHLEQRGLSPCFWCLENFIFVDGLKVALLNDPVTDYHTYGIPIPPNNL